MDKSLALTRADAWSLDQIHPIADEWRCGEVNTSTIGSQLDPRDWHARAVVLGRAIGS